MACTGICKGKTPKPVTAGDLEFCLCGVSWVNFNSGPGTAKLDPAEQVNSITHPKDPFTSLWFRSGNFNGLDPRPAWELDATLGFTEPDKDSPAGRWQVGFIQTVESLEYEAFYGSDWRRKALAGKSRDAGDLSVPPPWFGPPGSKGEPVDLPKAPKDHPLLSDDPEVQLLVAHPEAPCRQLERVTSKGRFHLWLIARDSRAPLDISHITFLWHASVVFDRAWVLPAGKDPFLTPNWQASGTQSKKDEGLGKGTKVPVLEKAVANDQLQFATTMKGKPCPAADSKP